MSFPLQSGRSAPTPAHKRAGTPGLSRPLIAVGGRL